MTRGVAIALTAVVLASSNIGAEDLKSVERELGEARRESAEIVGATSGLLGEIEKLDRRMVDSRAELERTERDLAKTSERRRAAQAELARLDRERSRLEALLVARAPGLQRVTRRGLGPLLFETAADRETRHRHRKYVAAIAARDREILDAVVANRAAAATERAAASDAERRLTALREERSRAVVRLEGERREKEKRLASLREEGSAKHAVIRELEQAAVRLRELLKKRPPPKSAAVPATPPTAWRWPLDRVTKIGRARNGVELPAERGAAILAVAAGTVVFADWFPGYGRLLVVDHGGHWHSIYGYAEDIRARTGDRVAGGQTIATVGSTGTTGDPSLYFEIRRRGEPQDPGGVLGDRRVEKGKPAP